MIINLNLVQPLCHASSKWRKADPLTGLPSSTHVTTRQRAPSTTWVMRLPTALRPK